MLKCTVLNKTQFSVVLLYATICSNFHNEFIFKFIIQFHVMYVGSYNFLFNPYRTKAYILFIFKSLSKQF